MKSLLIALLFLPSLSIAEDAPEAEYPYPSKKKVESNIEQPAKIDANGVYYYDTSKKRAKKKSVRGIEQPADIGADGTYYYNTKKKPKSKKGTIEQPVQKNKDGSYYYKKRTGAKKVRKTPGIPYPDKVLKDGTYIYNDDSDKTVSNILFIRGGVYGPPEITGPGDNPKKFSDVYSDSSSWILTADYEWKMFDFLGEFYLKFGSGISIQDGDGQFVDSLNNSEIVPKEKFQFILFPNTLSLSYKFQLWDIQYLTPYIDGGAGYYTFLERRSDGKKNNFGGAPVLSFSGGLLISLSIFGSGTSMANDYGIRQSWIDIQYRQVIGLDSRKDFSSNMITGGFALGF